MGSIGRSPDNLYVLKEQTYVSRTLQLNLKIHILKVLLQGPNWVILRQPMFL